MSAYRCATDRCTLYVFLLLIRPTTADILADGVLVYVPTRLLMILSDKTLRIRLILIFSTCIITSMVGLAHAAETFKSQYGTRIYTAIIEVRPFTSSSPLMFTHLEIRTTLP